MVEVRKAEVRFGSIEFHSAVEAVPPTTERPSPNVTVNNAGHPGRQAYFKVSFSMDFTAAEGESESYNIMTVSLPVTGMDAATPFRDVEQAAMRALVPMLRAFVDEVDQQVEGALIPQEPDQS